MAAMSALTGEEHFALGVAFGSGVGVDQDSARAFQYFAEAAEAGHVTACYSLGAMLLYGQGVEEDPQRAAFYFQKAAEGGNGKACLALGGMYEELEGGEEKALAYYKKAADLGLPDAQLCLADMLEQGTGGLEVDMGEAVEWYKKAAANGSTQAQTVMGEFYGNGCPPHIQKDLKVAEEYFLQAAGAEDPSACFHLGQLYKKETENAQSVGQGPKAATDSADGLSEDEDDDEDEHFLKEEEVSLSVKESAIYWYLRAKLLGHPRADFELVGLLTPPERVNDDHDASDGSVSRRGSAIRHSDSGGSRRGSAILHSDDDEQEWEDSDAKKRPRFRRSTVKAVFKREISADNPGALAGIDLAAFTATPFYDSCSSAPPSPTPARRRYGSIVQPGTPSRLGKSGLGNHWDD